MSETMQATAAAVVVYALKEYVSPVVKPALEQVGGLLSDTAKGWRFKNQVNTLLKTKRFLEEKGIRPQKVLPSVFFPLLEAAGDTDDEDLSAMFARLLAGHLDPARQDKVHPSFAKILGQLSPLDASVVKRIYGSSDVEAKRHEQRQRLGPAFPLDDTLTEWGLAKALTAEQKNLTERHVLLSLENLKRVGLVDNTGRWNDIAGLSSEGITMTVFGDSFMAACSE